MTYLLEGALTIVEHHSHDKNLEYSDQQTRDKKTGQGKYHCNRTYQDWVFTLFSLFSNTCNPYYN